MLTDTEKAILDLERGWYKYAAVKEQAIRDQFGWSTTRYYAVVNELIDRPDAMEWAPMVVRRLVRLREARRRARVTSLHASRQPSGVCTAYPLRCRGGPISSANRQAMPH